MIVYIGPRVVLDIVHGLEFRQRKDDGLIIGSPARVLYRAIARAPHVVSDVLVGLLDSPFVGCPYAAEVYTETVPKFSFTEMILQLRLHLGSQINLDRYPVGLLPAK